MSRTWRERFDSFAAKKTGAAVAAALPPYQTAFENPREDMVAIGNDWTRARFDGPFYLSPSPPARPSCSLVFVQSADGNTGAERPSDLGGGRTDEILIYEGLSRVAADAVLSGAETIRGGGTVFSVWHPELVRLRASLNLPRHPVQMVATVQGLDVERMLLFNVPELQVIVLTVTDAAARMKDALRARPWVTTVAMADRHDLRGAFGQLARLDVRRVSCIGGRRFAENLVEASLVDDLYLTTSPRPGGEPDTALPRAVRAGDVVVRKRGTGDETGVVFEHVALRHSAPASGRVES
jgi:5-amino-6-(5-phosphoribosylamino)uracil reductase